ncbi:MAG: glycosyltransferase [Nanoarchaeota archaeon]|nr:glycosyltransferase [Nanoarchaeota archaeon]MBU0962494.1 glycosyltransferase [Nanoarchaeota archaeon]
MKKYLKVSIIVAAYNEETHIEKLIKSVLGQTYKNLELVIIDDNSKDNTYNIIKEYSKKYKNIIVLQQDKNLRGPGNAWNLAVRKGSSGDILLFEGADTILAPNYVEKMVLPIISGKVIGTLHKEEKIANKNKIWARAYGKRICVDNNNEGIIFGAIKRDKWEEAGGFDSFLGYADDQTLYQKLKIKSLGVDAEIYHYNPETFREIWRQYLWIGSSNKKPVILLISLPFFPLWVLYKTLKHLKQDFYLPFILFLPLFYILKYFGFYFGVLRKIFFKKIYR